VIDLMDKIRREREGRSDQLYSFPTGFGLRPPDY